MLRPRSFLQRMRDRLPWHAHRRLKRRHLVMAMGASLAGKALLAAFLLLNAWLSAGP